MPVKRLNIDTPQINGKPLSLTNEIAFRYARPGLYFRSDPRLRRSMPMLLRSRFPSGALERTLNKQLFNSPGNRYYIKGKPDGGCFVYAEDPKITFKDDRIWIHIKTHSKLGTTMQRMLASALALPPKPTSPSSPRHRARTLASAMPEIEHLSTSRELNVFLVPFPQRQASPADED